MQQIKLEKMFSTRLTCVIVKQLAAQGETSTSKSSTDVAYCSHDIETCIIKNTITDHYTVLFHVKINCKLQSVTEQPFSVKLWKTLNDSSVLSKNDFNLNRVLGKFLEERYCDDDLTADSIKLHGVVEFTINQFIPTKATKQTKCKQSWVDNEVKNLATLKNNLYQTFLRDKSASSKSKYNQIRNKLQKLVAKKKRNFVIKKLFPTQNKILKAFLRQFVKLKELCRVVQ